MNRLRSFILFVSACFKRYLISMSLTTLLSIADRYSSLSTWFQSIICLMFAFNIKSSQIRVDLPFPSLNGCAMFISTYFSIISSNVVCGILSICSNACLRYIVGTNRKFPFAILTSLTFPAKS